MNAVIYKRVSTEEQAEDGHHSLDAQEKLCQDFAKREGYQVVKVFEDAGKSATTMNRPALKDMISFIEANNEISAVLVQDTDRIARNTLDHLTIKACLRKNKVSLISVSQLHLDDSAEGNMLDVVIASFNQMQSDITSRKTLKGLEQRARKGWFPGEAPVGYKNIDDGNGNKIIVPDPAKAPYIKMIFDMYVSTKLCAEKIKDIIYEKGFRAKRGGKIQLSKIFYILQNTFYYGEFTWNGTTYPGAHKPLITKEAFELVQEIMKARRGTRNYERKHSFLLSSFLFCDLCGRKFTAEHHTKHKHYYGYYHCTRGKKCDNIAVPLMLMEKQVEQSFNEINLSDDFKEKLFAKLKIKYQNFKNDVDDELKRLLASKNAIEHKRDKMEALLFESAIDHEVYNRNKVSFNNELETINTEILKLKDKRNIQLGSFEEIIAFAQDPYKTYLESNFEAKRLLLGFFWEKFLVKERLITKSIPTKIFQALQELQKPPVLKEALVKTATPRPKNFDKKFINLGVWGD